MCTKDDHGNGHGKYRVKIKAEEWKKAGISYTDGPDPEARTRVFQVTITGASSPKVMVKWRRFGPGDVLVGKGTFSNTLDFVLYPKDERVVIDFWCKEDVAVVAKRVLVV